MRVRLVPVSCMAVVCLLGLARPSAAACDPEGDVKFVCGMVSPEDLAAIPQSPWVIVSSMEHEGHLGHLYVADARDHSTTVLFPTATVRPRHDTATYGSCPGPATRNQFEPHGISLRPGSNGNHTLYVVRHGSRESIEVFQVDAGGGVADPHLGGMRCCAGDPRVECRGRSSRWWLRGDEPSDGRRVGMAFRHRVERGTGQRRHRS